MRAPPPRQDGGSTLCMLWSVLWSVLCTELFVGDSARPRYHAATPMCPAARRGPAASHAVAEQLST